MLDPARAHIILPLIIGAWLNLMCCFWQDSCAAKDSDATADLSFTFNEEGKVSVSKSGSSMAEATAGKAARGSNENDLLIRPEDNLIAVVRTGIHGIRTVARRGVMGWMFLVERGAG